MALNPFNRDTAYFQSMRDRGMMMNAEDFDFQFNNLVDYLNNKIVPLVNRLNAKEIPGTNETDTFLLNVGDGTTKWTKVNSNLIADFSVPISKLSNSELHLFDDALGSVLATNNSKVFTATEPTAINQVLASRQNNTPIWRLIETGDILNQSITGNKLGLLSIDPAQLSGEVIGGNIHPNTILNRHILDGNITGDKLQDGAIVERSIHYQLVNERLQKLRVSVYSPKNHPELNEYTLLDNSIENRHFAPKIVMGGNKNGGEETRYNGHLISSMQLRPTPEVDDDINYTFTSDNIIDNSLTDSVLGGAYGSMYSMQQSSNRIFAQGAVQARHIRNGSLNLHLFSKGSIRKEKLSAQLRQKLGI